MLPPSLPPRRLLPLFATLSTLPLNDRRAALGTLILGAPGAGKTILLSLFLLVDLLRGLPGIVLDPLGTLSEAFLFRLAWFLSEFPPGDDELLWQRLRYIPLGEAPVTHFPIYFQRDRESLWDAGHRLITVLERASPQLVSGAPLTWPAARRLALNAGMLFTALGYGGLTNIEDLLFNTLDWEKAGRFDEAISRNPQAKDAVSYFRNHYLPLPRSEQRRVAGTLLDQVYPFVQNPTLQAIFSGSSTPGIDWEAVEAKPELVIINCKGIIRDPTSLRFALHWIFEHIYPHLKERGRHHTPFVVMIDEFVKLAASGTGDNKPLADLFDELLAQYARNNTIFVTIAFQSLDQVDERLQQTLLRLGTIITGRAGSDREARVIGDRVFTKDISRVQHYRKVWGKVDPPPFIRGYSPPVDIAAARYVNPTYPYFVLDYEPEYMSLEKQTEDAAGMIQKLGTLEFLCRPALPEGAGGEDVVSLALAPAITDPDTGEDIFPDPERDHALISQVQQQLAARSGVPMEEIPQEQEARLTTGTPRNPQQAQTLQAEEVRERQPFQLPERTQPGPRKARETPSHPTLTEQEQALLAFLIANPDSPASVVAKELRIRAAEGTKIRESLKAQGFMQELEVRTGRTTAGRPTKFLLPTFQAFELLGIEPPNGRGGALHRHIQQVVQEGARAKGYNARVEYQLPSGAIVDVHLERGGEKIAVEVAVLSHPSREVAHIRQHLDAGYDKVCTVFADPRLLERTREASAMAFSEAERSRIQLLPISKLAGVG